MSYRVEDGFYKWPKKQAAELFPGNHFHTTEMACPCVHPECGEQRISVALVTKLNMLREFMQEPLLVHSGYRCAKHQQDLAEAGLQTATGRSTHELGEAVDIAPRNTSQENMKRFFTYAEGIFKAIGIARSWLHLDTRSDKERRWTYQGIQSTTHPFS